MLKCSCGVEMQEYKQGWKCPGCGRWLWKESFGHKFTAEELQKLARDEKIFVNGLVGRKKKPFAAYLQSVKQGQFWKLLLTFSNSKGGGAE